MNPCMLCYTHYNRIDNNHSYKTLDSYCYILESMRIDNRLDNCTLGTP